MKIKNIFQKKQSKAFSNTNIRNQVSLWNFSIEIYPPTHPTLRTKVGEEASITLSVKGLPLAQPQHDVHVQELHDFLHPKVKQPRNVPARQRRRDTREAARQAATTSLGVASEGAEKASSDLETVEVEAVEASDRAEEATADEEAEDVEAHINCKFAVEKAEERVKELENEAEEYRHRIAVT